MNNNVLVVDDEEAVFYVISEILTMAGFKVHCAENGKKALEILANEEIHLFFLDLRLPLMSGLDLCREIRKKNSTDFICAMTGYTHEFSIVQCRQAGFDEYITKPFKNSIIVDIAKYGAERIARWEEYCKG